MRVTSTMHATSAPARKIAPRGGGEVQIIAHQKVLKNRSFLRAARDTAAGVTYGVDPVLIFTADNDPAVARGGSWIVDDGFDQPSPYAAGIAQFLDRKRRAAEMIGSQHGGRAASRKQDADTPRGHSRRIPGACFAGNRRTLFAAALRGSMTGSVPRSSALRWAASTLPQPCSGCDCLITGWRYFCQFMPKYKA
jgi:hypothetical protein